MFSVLADDVDGMVDRVKARALLVEQLEADASGVTSIARPLTPEEWSRSPEAQAGQAAALAMMRRAGPR